MYRRIFLLLCFLIFVKVQGQQFTDITKQSGIDHYFEVYEGMFGGGIAVLDYNNDGFEDLYITGGMQEDQLLENLQNGTFKNVLKTFTFMNVAAHIHFVPKDKERSSKYVRVMHIFLVVHVILLLCFAHYILYNLYLIISIKTG